MSLGINNQIASFGFPSLGGASASAGAGAAGKPDLSNKIMQDVMKLLTSLIGMFSGGGGGGCTPQAGSTAGQLPQPGGLGAPAPQLGAAGGRPPVSSAGIGNIPSNIGATTMSFDTLKYAMSENKKLADGIAKNPKTADRPQAQLGGKSALDLYQTQNAAIGAALQNMPVGELRAHRGEIKDMMDKFQGDAAKAQSSIKGKGDNVFATLKATSALDSASIGVGTTYGNWAAANVRDGVRPG